MKINALILLSMCLPIVLSGCQDRRPTKEREFGTEQKVLFDKLQSDFTEDNFKKLMNDGGVLFFLFLGDASRKPVDGVWLGGAGKLIYNDFRYGTKGFSIELSTSMLPVVFYSVDFVPEGVRVWYWSQDFTSSNEQLTQEEIDKYSVYRLYEGVLSKNQFLKVLKNRLLFVYKFDEKSQVAQNFYVMRVVKEQKERPQKFE